MRHLFGALALAVLVGLGLFLSGAGLLGGAVALGTGSRWATAGADRRIADVLFVISPFVLGPMSSTTAAKKGSQRPLSRQRVRFLISPQ